MIKLTQEKREELAQFAKATLNSLNGIEPEIKLARLEDIPCPTYNDNNYAQGYLDGCKAVVEANKRLNGLGE